MSIINNLLDSIHNDNPVNNIVSLEFQAALLKFGALVSILNNKRANNTMIMVLLLENLAYRECLKEMSGIDDDRLLFKMFIAIDPILCNSKIIKNKLK